MAKRLRKPRPPELLEDYRRESGWWLAAWRDFKGLTLDELAIEVGTSKGVVSDLETGAKRAGGQRAQRFKSDQLGAYARALGITEGRLLELNPFTQTPEREEVATLLGRLDDAELKMVRDLAESLLKRAR